MNLNCESLIVLFDVVGLVIFYENFIDIVLWVL